MMVLIVQTREIVTQQHPLPAPDLPCVVESGTTTTDEDEDTIEIHHFLQDPIISFISHGSILSRIINEATTTTGPTITIITTIIAITTVVPHLPMRSAMAGMEAEEDVEAEAEADDFHTINRDHNNRDQFQTDQ